MPTLQVALAVPPRPSDTRTVALRLAGALTPVVSSLTLGPEPVIVPALVDQV